MELADHFVANPEEELLTDVVALSSHGFGNFVVLHVLNHCGSDIVSRVVSTL